MVDIEEKLDNIENRLIKIETEFQILKKYGKYLLLSIAAIFGINLQGYV